MKPQHLCSITDTMLDIHTEVIYILVEGWQHQDTAWQSLQLLSKHIHDILISAYNGESGYVYSYVYAINYIASVDRSDILMYYLLST